jgi:type II secretory pathway component PulJ
MANESRVLMKRLLAAILIASLVLTLSSSTASAAGSTDARIAELEKQVATLKAEVESLKALEKQALFLRTCVNTEKSTNSLKVSMKLASCTVDYFKKSRAAEKK